MCEICKKHGNGNKWYFNPKNYSKEMGEARKELLEKIASSRHFERWMIHDFENIEKLKNIPILNKIALNLGERYLKKTHGGQIILLNDAIKVLELCENPVVLPCTCRQIAGKEKYCCLNFGLLPELYKKANPDEYMEEISVNKAKKLLQKWNGEGLYHVILWNEAPYVTTICSCTAAYCVAYRGRFVSRLKNVMLKGEYIARVDEIKCVGCKKCLTRCQFGAISFNVDEEKAFIDIRKCFGCGLCATVCPNNAIELVERKLTPAKNLW
ncbi:MAG: 4Fe-4S dicluster domain-containing protein [Candidatus Syntropharchaeia archaeon]